MKKFFAFLVLALSAVYCMADEVSDIREAMKKSQGYYYQCP